MEIILKPVNELMAYENNPRVNDRAVEPVAKSIKEFGFKVPILLDKDNVIIAGHTRLKAAKERGTMSTIGGFSYISGALRTHLERAGLALHY